MMQSESLNFGMSHASTHLATEYLILNCNSGNNSQFYMMKTSQLTLIKEMRKLIYILNIVAK